jgi:hypothetical protein
MLLKEGRPVEYVYYLLYFTAHPASGINRDDQIRLTDSQCKDTFAGLLSFLQRSFTRPFGCIYRR